MNPEHQQYLPAVAEHAKEWVLLVPQKEPLLIWNPEHWRASKSSDTVFETELLQLMQWIEERERLVNISTLGGRYRGYLEDVSENAGVSAHWHERWQAICKVKGWKETL